MRPSRTSAVLVVLAAVTFGARVSPAATVTWTSAVSGNWNDGTKWSTNPNPPQPGDDVIINVAGTYTVSLNVDATINSLTLGTSNGMQTLQTANFRILTLAGPNPSTVNPGGVLSVSGGTLTGAGDLTVAGALTWIAGTISGSGALTVNGALTFDSSSSKTLDGRTLVSNGSAVWKGGGPVNLSNGALLRNGATGMFDIQFPAAMSITGAPSSESFENLGTLTKSAGAGLAAISVPMNSSGPVQANNGTLAFNGGGTWGGSLTATAPAVLRFGGGTHGLNGVTIGGSGRTEITAGTVNTNGAVTVDATATLATSATLGGSGALTVNGALAWTAGAIAGSGALTVNGLLTLGGSGKVLNGRTLVSNGGAVFQGGTLSLSNGAVYRNAAGSTFDIQIATTIAVSGTPAGETFDNDGTLIKSAGGGIGSIDVFMDSTGPVQANNGTLRFGGGGTWSGTLTLGGGLLRFAGGTHNLSNVTIGGSGRTEITSAIFNSAGPVTVGSMVTLANSGTVGGGGALTVNGTFEWTAQTVVGSGSFTVNGMLTLDGSGKVLNERTLVSNGSAVWKGGGAISLSNGAVLRNAASGVFDVQNDASMNTAGTPAGELFDNQGTLTKSMGAGTTFINVAMTNSGTVEIKSGVLRLTQATYVQTAGATILNGGHLTPQAGMGMNIQGGALRGTGTVTGNVINSGTVAPGLSAGKLTITGTYMQMPSGALAIEIGGLAAQTQFDQLDVNGTAALNGALNVSLIDGFSPVQGNQFLVLDGTTSGTFSTTDLPPLSPGLSWQVIVGSVLLQVGGAGATPTASVTSAATATRTRTATHTPSGTSTITRTRTRTPTGSPPATGTASATPTWTRPTATSTVTATFTPVIGTATATTTATPTGTATRTATQTATASRTATATSTATATPSQTPSATLGTQTPSPTPTRTGMADFFKIAGTVLGPGPRGITPPGLVPAVGQAVDLFTCMRQQGCLLSPGTALLMATTDDRGMYMFTAPRSIVQNRLWVLLQAVVGGVRCRVLLSPARLAALAGAGAALEGGAAGLPLIVIDPIQEAAVRLLEAAGVENYDDEGIDAVVDAVEQANATTAFDGLSVAEANDLAEVTAANDPDVQMVLAARKRTPTPTATAMPPGCAGDCDGSGSVGVNELIRGVNISLGNASLSICPAFDRDGSLTVSIGELIGAVNRSLNGC